MSRRRRLHHIQGYAIKHGVWIHGTGFRFRADSNVPSSRIYEPYHALHIPAWQGRLAIHTCPPAHSCLTSTTQGGQGPLWQLYAHRCPQARRRLQGLGQGTIRSTPPITECVRVCAYACACVCTCMYSCVDAYVYMYVYMDVGMYGCLCPYIHVSMFVCMFVGGHACLHYLLLSGQPWL